MTDYMDRLPVVFPASQKLDGDASINDLAETLEALGECTHGFIGIASGHASPATARQSQQLIKGRYRRQLTIRTENSSARQMT